MQLLKEKLKSVGNKLICQKSDGEIDATLTSTQ